MEILFLGTGEAYSHHRSNTSILVNKRLLIDCGFSIPERLWALDLDKDAIEYIHITHFHADHTAGLPVVLMKFRQEGRTNPLTIIGPKGLEEYFKLLFEVSYKGFLHKLPFPIKYIEAKSGNPITFGNMELDFTNAKHLEGEQEVEVLSIKVGSEGKSFCYSSDTSYCENVAGLAKGCDLLIHESYLPHTSEYHGKMKAHSSPKEAVDIANMAGAKNLALVHLHRDFAKNPLKVFDDTFQEFSGKLIIPNDGDLIKL